MKKILSLLALVLMSCMGAWADEAFRFHRYDTFKVTPINENSIVFVGNSITNMHPWVEAFGNDSRIVNRGNSGGTSSEILREVRSYCVGHPAKIFLMIGINDKPNNSNQASIVTNIENTIKAIQAESPTTQIYVQSILPSARSGFSNPTDIANCNTAIQTMLAGYPSVTYVDVYSLLLDKVNAGGAYSYDLLHLTAASYEIWTKKLQEYIDCTSVYPTGTDTKQVRSVLPQDSFGMRGTYFSMLPISSNDVLFFGDEMVHGGEWQELLGNIHVKNRGTNWDYDKTINSMTYTSGDIDCTFSSVDGVTKQQPKQVLLYTGTGEVNNTANSINTVVETYKSLVDKIRVYAPAAKISLVSLMPTTTAGNARVKAFNSAIEAYAGETANVEYIDIYSTLAVNDNVNTAYFPASNNYLYGDGYVAVANVLADHIADCHPVTPEQATAYRKLVKGTNADEDFFEEGWYQIQIGEGTGYQNYHQQYKGMYLYAYPHTVGSNNWGIGLTDNATLPESYVYISGAHDSWHIHFKHGASDAYYTTQNCLKNASAANLYFIPNGDQTQWKIWGNNSYRWMGWDLSGPSIGSTSTSGNDSYDNCYFVFKKIKTVTPEVGKSYRVAVRYSDGSLHYVKGESFSTSTAEADVYEVVNSGNAEYPYAFVTEEGKYLTSHGQKSEVTAVTDGRAQFKFGDIVSVSSSYITQAQYKRAGGIHLTSRQRFGNISNAGCMIVQESNSTYNNSTAPYMDGTYSSCIILEEVPTFKVTYTFNLDGEKIGEWTVNEEEGAAPTVAGMLPSYARIVSGLPTTVTNTEYTLETAHQNLPFALGDDHRYYINLWGVANRHYLLYANSSNTAVKETKQDQTSVDPSALDDDVKFQHMWVVGGDWFNGFTFQNLLGYYIAAPSATPANEAATVATKTEGPLCHYDPFFQTGLTDYSFRIHGGNNNFAHTSDGSKSLSFYNAYSGDKLIATTLHFIDANADYVRLTTPVVLTNPNPTGASGLDNKYVATFSSAYDVTLPTGVVAYTAEIDGSTVNFHELGSVVPANTGVLLYAAGASANVNDHATLFTGSTPAVEANALRPANGTIEAGTYVLGKGSHGVGFYARQTATTVANKAYLEVPAGSNLSVFRFDFEDSVTGIEAVESNALEVYFDLQGRRVQGGKSGLYIVNGKKVIR